MEYNFEINSETKIIQVITIGDLMTKEVVAMGFEIMTKAKLLKSKILYDNRLSKNRISLFEAYDWYHAHYDNIDGTFRYIPTAYVANVDDWDFYSFFECTSINKGIPLRVFKEKQLALSWLENRKINI